MSFLDNGDAVNAGDLAAALDGLQIKTDGLVIGANAFSSAMAKAFAQASAGGRQFDDVLKSLALRLSNLVVALAFKPFAKDLSSGLAELLGGVFGSSPALGAQMGAIKPFASGGVIGTPSYFPLAGGGVGLAGEAGPEAIMPLARAADGSLGVAATGGTSAPHITVQIATPDAASFRRSEAYVTGQIARAVARGRRSL